MKYLLSLVQESVSLVPISVRHNRFWLGAMRQHGRPPCNEERQRQGRSRPAKWVLNLRFFALVVIGTCLLSGTEAAIFGLNRAFPALSKQDLKLLTTTAREEMTGKPEGTVLEWKNPRSGAAGTVTLVKRFWKNEQECRNIVHDFNVRGTERWNYKSTICHQADGSWKDYEARF